MARKLILEIVGDSRSFERALGRSGHSVDSFGRRMNRAASNIAKAGVFAGAAVAIGSVTVALRAGISEFAESAKVQAQTRAALKSTGGVANVTSGQIDRLATSLMNVTGVDDELVKTSENLLLTFKNVRNEVGLGNQVFTRATKSALDLSQAGFGSVESASKMLGKALNDPVKGMTALGRAGVTFSAAQKDAIKSLVETGRTLEAQKLILKEVESQVGGSAKAYGQTLPGMLKILRENLNNVAGDLVKTYAPAFKDAVHTATAWVKSAENQRRVIAQVRDVIDKLIAVTKTMIGVIRTAANVMQKFSDAVGGAKNATYGLAAAIAAVKLSGLIAGLVATRGAAGGAAANVGLLRTRLRLLAGLAIPAIVIPIGFKLAGQAKGDPFAAKEGDSLNKLTDPKAWQHALDPRNFGKDIGAALNGIFGNQQTKAEIEKAGAKAFSDITKVLTDALRGAGKTATGPANPFAGLSEALHKALDPVAAKAKATASRTGHTLGLVSGQGYAKGVQAAVDEWARRGLKLPLPKFQLGGQVDITSLQRGLIPAHVGGSVFKKGLVGGLNQRAQFRALGLTGTGDELAPTRNALRAQALKLGEAVKGTFLDTGKTQSVMVGIRKVLSGQLGALSREMRLKVKELLDALAGQLGDRGPLTRASAASLRQLVQGTGLKGAGLRQLEFNLAGAHLTSQPIGTRGGGVVITGPIHVHGVQDPRSFYAEMQKTARRRPTQTRGRQLP